MGRDSDTLACPRGILCTLKEKKEHNAVTWHGVEREVLGFWAYSFILKNKELTRYERLRDKRFTAKGDFGFATKRISESRAPSS